MRRQTPTRGVLKCGEENAQGRDIFVCPECLSCWLKSFGKAVKDATVKQVFSYP